MTTLAPGLIASYHRTIYRVHDTARVDKRIGRRSPEIEQVMRRYRVRTASVLTAENPGSRQQADLINRIRAWRLDSAMKALGLTWLPTSAIDLDGVWPPETGRFVLGPSFPTALRLAKRFDQNAFLWVTFGRPTELVLSR